MTPQKRTILSVTLFTPLAAILLATFACLPAPVGDPETAKVDATLVGAWQGVPKDADSKDKALALLRAWDAHTYFVQYIFTETKDGKEETKTLCYKGWLTELGGTTFIVCEALDDKVFLADAPPAGAATDRYWWTAKLDRKDNTVTATPVDETSPLLKDLKTRETLEAAIKANLKDAKLYREPMTFKKLDKEQLKAVDEARERANIGLP